MALHKQYLGSGYNKLQEKDKLEITLFDMSDKGKRKRQRIIDNKVCKIETIKTGLQRFNHKYPNYQGD